MIVPAFATALQLASMTAPPGASVAAPPAAASAAAAPAPIVIYAPPYELAFAVQPQPQAPAPESPPPAVPGTPAEAAGATAGDQAPAGNPVIVVTARELPPPGDPMMVVNEKSYAVMQSVDSAVIAPISTTYRKVLPGPVRDGLRNVLLNLNEPVVFLNFLLQGKPGKALETVARFTVNSTVGIAGLLDVAKNKPFHMPYRNNGFADTMGYYGIGPGPFLFLPLVGPTTVRDLAGLLLDKTVVPTAFGGPFRTPAYVFSSGTIKSLNDRVDFDARLKALRECSNPYASAREFYLELREEEIEGLHGRGPMVGSPTSLASKQVQCSNGEEPAMGAQNTGKTSSPAAPASPAAAPAPPESPNPAATPAAPATPSANDAVPAPQKPAPEGAAPTVQSPAGNTVSLNYDPPKLTVRALS